MFCFVTDFDVPSVPENLHCKVLIESADKKLGKISNLSAECFWDPPQSKTPDITGYRIVSGLQKSSNDLTTLDKTTAHMRVVKPVRLFCLMDW